MKFNPTHMAPLALSFALLATFHPLRGQTVNPPAKPTAGDEVVTLSVFEVTSESDRGILSTNSVSATKNNTPIKDYPRQYLRAQRGLHQGPDPLRSE
jgi:hypothetical protein